MSKSFENILEVEGINSKGFGTIAKLVMMDQRLSIEAKAIYSYFCSYAGGGSTAFPSVSKILYDLKISKTRYYKHFNLLVDYGYISVKQIKEENKFGKNLYTLHTNPVPIPQNEDTELSYPQNEDTQNEDTQNEDSNINNININNINNILDDDDDTRICEITELENMFEMYSSKKLTKANKQSLNKLLDVVNKDLLIYSIQKLEDVEKPMPYLKSIIKDYLSKNISTVMEAMTYDKNFKQNRQNKSSKKTTGMINGMGTPITEGYFNWMEE